MPKNRFAEFEAGGFTVDYAGTVTRARFGVNMTYGAHTLRCFITTKLDEPQTTADGKVITERTEEFNVGPTESWTELDDGRSFGHVSGDPEKWIAGTSDYAELLVRAASLGAQETLEAKGDPTEGRMWEGTRWHWVTEEKPYKVRDKVTKKQVEGVKNVNRPSSFLGTSGSPVGNGQVAFDLDGLGLPESTLETLRAIAKDAGSGGFMAKALGFVPTLDDEKERDTVVDALGTTGFYEALTR